MKKIVIVKRLGRKEKKNKKRGRKKQQKKIIKKGRATKAWIAKNASIRKFVKKLSGH
jgi:hypothetical protein